MHARRSTPSLRRAAIAAAAVTIFAGLAVPATTISALGGSSAGSDGGHSAMPTSSKFSAAALAVGRGKTPADRARIMARVTADLPIQVAAYHVKPLWKQGITGKGVGIATIVSYGDPDIQAVIDDYDQRYGLPKAKVTILAPVGDPTCPPGHESTCASWAGETDLDVEMFHTLAPGAHIYVVATPVAETLGLHGFPEMMKAIDYIVKHKIVQVISMSLGATEETFKSGDQIKSLDPTMRRAKAAGVPIVAASGDYGASGPKRGGKYFTHRVVGWPASDPLVTAVGGTILHMSGTHRTAPDSLISFSGGGLSHVYARPAWQDSVKGITKSKMRSMPDITMEGIYGTSMAAPLFGGVLALATQANGGKPLGFLNPVLYKMGPSWKTDGLVDVTDGNNTYDGVTGYACAKGWDIASGYGTINAQKFVPALVKAISTP